MNLGLYFALKIKIENSKPFLLRSVKIILIFRDIGHGRRQGSGTMHFAPDESQLRRALRTFNFLFGLNEHVTFLRNNGRVILA